MTTTIPEGQTLEGRLNPCFIGMYRDCNEALILRVESDCLNPCFIGMYRDGVEKPVIKRFNNMCLNPCFSGIYRDHFESLFHHNW